MKFKSKLGEKITPWIISILLIIIVNWRYLFGDEKFNVLSTILTLFIGLSLGNQIFKPQKMPKNSSKLLTNFAIGVYTIIYLLFAGIIDFNFYFTNYSLFSFKILFGVFLFYNGFKAIQTRKAWNRGGQLNKSQSVFSGTLSIIFSIIILFARFILAWSYG